MTFWCVIAKGIVFQPSDVLDTFEVNSDIFTTALGMNRECIGLFV